MKIERTVALISLALICIVALIVAAIDNDIGWSKDIALVAVGGLAGVITAPMLSKSE